MDLDESGIAKIILLFSFFKVQIILSIKISTEMLLVRKSQKSASGEIFLDLNYLNSELFSGAGLNIITQRLNVITDGFNCGVSNSVFESNCF